MRNVKSLTLAVAVVAMLATPAFAAAERDNPKRDLGDRFTNVITRLVTRIVHVFDVYPIVPQPKP